TVRQEDYNTWPELWEVFDHIRSIDSYMDKTTTFSMSISRQCKDFSGFKKELKLILPYITKEENGYKIINVFDHYLCENGDVVYFRYKDDDDCFIKRSHYSWVADPDKNTIDSVLEWWRDHRWYDND